MNRRVVLNLLAAASGLMLTGCRVDANNAASQALQSVINTAFANLVAGVVNSIFPTM